MLQERKEIDSNVIIYVENTVKLCCTRLQLSTTVRIYMWYTTPNHI